MPTTSRAVRQLSDANAIGTILGASSSDGIGFYGLTTGVAQIAIGGSLTTGTFVSSLANALATLGLVTVSTVAT